MRLVRVSAPGTVDLTTRGALLDANDVQTVDERDMERLKGMWDRLNILASDDPAVYEQQVMRQVDSQCGQLTTAYHSYFALQTAINAQGGRDAYLGMLAGDASYGFRQNPDGLSDSELDALALERAAAWLDATIADWEKQLNSLRPFWPTRTMRPCALTARPSTLSG